MFDWCTMLLQPMSSTRSVRHALKSFPSGWKLKVSRGTHTTASGERRYTPRRAVLYVPGSDRRKIDKVASLDVDCVVLDCEDGVALNRKEEARTTIRQFLDSGTPGLSGKDCSVRVNDVTSGFCRPDLETLLSAQRLPDTLHLPKVEDTEQIEWFIDQLKQLAPASISRPVDLILFTESATGMLNLRAICERTRQLTVNTPFSLDGIVFGSDDYCADIGATRSSDGSELLFARQNLVMIAAAFKLQAIDAVYIDYKDLAGLRRQAEEGARFGFSGKQVIHPGQVPVVQEAFSPSLERAAWAAQLVAAFQQHQRTGKGAFTFRGAMIDRPLLLQAQNVLKIAQLARPGDSDTGAGG